MTLFIDLILPHCPSTQYRRTRDRCDSRSVLCDIPVKFIKFVTILQKENKNRTEQNYYMYTVCIEQHDADLHY